MTTKKKGENIPLNFHKCSFTAFSSLLLFPLTGIQVYAKLFKLSSKINNIIDCWQFYVMRVMGCNLYGKKDLRKFEITNEICPNRPKTCIFCQYLNVSQSYCNLVICFSSSFGCLVKSPFNLRQFAKRHNFSYNIMIQICFLL